MHEVSGQEMKLNVLLREMVLFKVWYYLWQIYQSKLIYKHSVILQNYTYFNDYVPVRRQYFRGPR